MKREYKCPYCNYKTDNLFVYCIHVVEKHKNELSTSRKAEGGDAK